MNNLRAEQSDSTASSLLFRIRSRDGEAWRRFAAIYTPLVYAWARRGGLQETDAADVVQDVFRTVFDKIDTFGRDGQSARFRGWLWTITRNRVHLFYRRTATGPEAVGGSEAAHAMQQHAVLLEHESDPTNAGEHAALLGRALRLIQADFTEQSWQAFWRVAVDAQPAAAVADELGMSPSAVRQAKYRILCRLRDELAGL